MSKRLLLGLAVTAGLAVLIALTVRFGSQKVQADAKTTDFVSAEFETEPVAQENGFAVEVLVDGRPIPEYAGRGRRYVEALENAEYELRIRNPFGTRVAVAVSVDGLNSIDARHTSAWDAHKWVIQPYGTIYVKGWQMSSDSARRFYFTTERDSYGTKLGQTANLGVISAVFYRERSSIVVPPVTRGPYPPQPTTKDDSARNEESPARAQSQAGSGGRDAAKEKSITPYPIPDDESAATGIGRAVRNDVRWINMDLETRPAGEITIRYEYRASLVRLGILPREYPRPNVLDRRERAQGFEPRYCPQP